MANRLSVYSPDRQGLGPRIPNHSERMLSKLDVRPADVLTNDRTKATLCTFAGLTCVALSLQSWSSPIYASRCYAFDKGDRERLSLIHISEPTRLGMISYAVFCLKKKK